MGLITVTKAKVKTDWLGREKIDDADKGKKMMIPTDNIVRIEGWNGGSKIFMEDGSELTIKESLDHISVQG